MRPSFILGLSALTLATCSAFARDVDPASRALRLVETMGRALKNSPQRKDRVPASDNDALAALSELKFRMAKPLRISLNRASTQKTSEFCSKETIYTVFFQGGKTFSAGGSFAYADNAEDRPSIAAQLRSQGFSMETPFCALETAMDPPSDPAICQSDPAKYFAITRDVFRLKTGTKFWTDPREFHIEADDEDSVRFHNGYEAAHFVKMTESQMIAGFAPIAGAILQYDDQENAPGDSASVPAPFQCTTLSVNSAQNPEHSEGTAIKWVRQDSVRLKDFKDAFRANIQLDAASIDEAANPATIESNSVKAPNALQALRKRGSDVSGEAHSADR